jgi:hypothetical protein
MLVVLKKQGVQVANARSDVADERAEAIQTLQHAEIQYRA